MLCRYQGCHSRHAKYYQHPHGLVCATHDKLLGRQALMSMGFSQPQAIRWETYPDETPPLGRGDGG